jgi:hypothetical protein
MDQHISVELARKRDYHSLASDRRLKSVQINGSNIAMRRASRLDVAWHKLTYVEVVRITLTSYIIECDIFVIEIVN